MDVSSTPGKRNKPMSDNERSRRAWHSHTHVPYTKPMKPALVTAGEETGRPVNHSHPYGAAAHEHSPNDNYAAHGTDIIVGGKTVGQVR